MQTTAKKLEEYYNNSSEYLADLTTHGEKYLAPYLNIVFHTEKETNKKVLEIGGGEGRAGKLLSDKYHKVAVIDISYKFTKHASDKYKKGNLYYLTAKAEYLPFKKQSFDLIVALETIEHIPDIASFLQEINRVLKKKGRIIIVSPNLCSPLFALWDLLKLVCFSQARPPFTMDFKSGVKRLIWCLRINIKKRFSKKPQYQYRDPVLDKEYVGGDWDACYLPDPLDIKKTLKGYKQIKIKGQSFKASMARFLSGDLSPILAVILEK